MKAQVLLAGFVLAAVACSGPESGQVVAKHYEEPYVWSQLSCAAYNPQGACTVYVPITFTQPEEWVLTLRSGEEQGDRSVYRQAYERCNAGDTYPLCASRSDQ